MFDYEARAGVSYCVEYALNYLLIEQLFTYFTYLFI